MPLGNQHGLVHRLVVQRTAVHIHTELVQIQCLRLACLGLVDGYTVDVTHEEVYLRLQSDFLKCWLLAAHPQGGGVLLPLGGQRLDIPQLHRVHILCRGRYIRSYPAEQIFQARVTFTEGRLRVLRGGQCGGIVRNQVYLNKKAVLAGVNSLTPNSVEQPVFDGTPVDTQLHTAGAHIALIVDGVCLGGQDVAVLAADGQRASTQVAGNLTIILHAALLPRRQQWRQCVPFFCTAADLQHLHGDIRIR